MGLYVVQSLFFSFTLHCGQRSERGLSERLWLAYIGYCVQFLHQCHLSKSLPLTYSTIQTITNKHYVTADICRCRLLSSLDKKQLDSFFLASRTFREALIVSVSFPDVKGTLPPTIGATLVHAIPALRIAKKHTLTHKTFSTDNRCRAAFLPFYFKSKTISLSFYFKKIYRVFFVANKFRKALIT